MSLLTSAAKVSPRESWELELQCIPKSHREEEATLFRTRWFDYRHLLPGQATYVFASCYVDQYRLGYATLIDVAKAPDVKPLKEDDVFDDANLLCLWQARQTADRIGCTYEFYLDFVFKRTWERGWRYMPKPNQLYGDELEADAKDAWVALRSVSLQLAKNDRFKTDAFVGHPDQVAYHDYLIEEVENRQHKHMLLARLVFKERVLPVEVAGRYFGADMVRRAFIFAQR